MTVHGLLAQGYTFQITRHADKYRNHIEQSFHTVLHTYIGDAAISEMFFSSSTKNNENEIDDLIGLASDTRAAN